MNNGNPPNPNPFNFNGLVPFHPITPEQYHNNMAQIQAVREMLAAMEQTNIQQYETYRREQERQQLEAIAEQGRLAQQRLAQLNSGWAAQNTYAPPVADPFSAAYVAGQPASGYNEVPSSARIVEVPSSTQGSPQVQSSGNTSQARWGEPSQLYAQRPANATQTRPNPTAGSSASHNRAPAPAAPSATQGATQPHTYGFAHRTANGQTYGHSTSSSVHQSATPNHYSVSQPSGSTSGQTLGTSSQPPASRVTHASSSIPHVNGISTTQQASRSSASSSTTQSVRGPTAASQAGSSSTPFNAQPPPTSRPTESSSNATQQGGAPKAPPYVDGELLYRVFKNVPANSVKELMLATHAMIKTQQKGSTLTAMEWEAYGRLNEKARQVVDLLTLRLKDVPVNDVRDAFAGVYARLRGQTETQPVLPQSSATSATVNAPPQPVQLQPPSMTLPPTNPQKQMQASPAQLPSVSDGNAPQANAVHTRPPSTTQSSIQQSQQTNLPPSQPPATRPPVTNPPSSSVVPTLTKPNGAPTEVQWYMPSDPTAPMAYRNADGQLQFLFKPRSQQASASSPASQTVLSTPKPAQTPYDLWRTSTPQSFAPFAPPAEQQSKSSWSPQKADRRRLAQDIMRSLGRPKGAFGTPLPPLTTPSSEVIEPSTESGKRKQSPVSTPSTPSKRQRVGDGGNENDALPDASLSVENKAGHAGVLVAPLPPEPTSDTDIIDLTMEGPDADGAVGVEQTDRPETIPPAREPSVTSSDAADAHQVQEAIIGAAPEPSSGPSSPVVRTTKSPSLGAALDEVNRLHPSQDLDYAGGADTFDMPEESIALLSPTRHTEPSTSQAAASSPASASVVRGKEKLPLFLPSRSSSPEPDFSRQASAPPPTDDEDLVSVTSSVLPGGPKGKGKARQTDTDVEMASSLDGDVSPRRKRPRSKVYVLAPPLPSYARKRQSPSKAASREVSVDELATCPVDEDEDKELSEEDKEVQAAAELSYSRLRETPCQWSGCGAILNSTHTLQKHLALHAGEQAEWGSYACRWHGCLANRFVDKVGLVKHLNKHALIPLRCAYEGCDELFDAPGRLLEHHQSSKHRNGTGVLRPSCELFLHAERRRPLPPLPEVVPAYMAVPCRVSMHPISKERHQWLGAKVLENIICFKWQGRRSNAAAPSRGSRRLAEKMAATELAGKTPAESLALIKRWIDGEYLDLADGYDASRRHHLHCGDIGSGEVTQMVNNGLVLFSDEPEPPPAAPKKAQEESVEEGAASASTAGPGPANPSTVVGPELDAAALQHPTASVVGATEANVAAPGTTCTRGKIALAKTKESYTQPGQNIPFTDQFSGGCTSCGVLASGPHDRADQLVGDVSDPDGKVDAGGRLELPRRSNFTAAVAGNAVAELGPGELQQEGGSAQIAASTQQQEARVEER